MTIGESPAGSSFFRESRLFASEHDTQPRKSIFSFAHAYQIDRPALQAYLSLGYVPGHRTLFRGITCLPGRFDSLSSGMVGGGSLQSVFDSLPTIEHTPSRLKEVLLESISRQLNPGLLQVVPLSGGMDSRLLLAGLNEITSLTNVQTYTFGVPGAYDFDIPGAIAKKFGTKHRSFSAKHTRYSVDGLVRAAEASDGNTEVMHPLVLNSVVDFYGEGAVFWSGYAGDLVGGAFGETLAPDASPKRVLIDYESRGLKLKDARAEEEVLLPLISSGEKFDGLISPAEAVFWENHVERYTAHHIFRNDMCVRAPLVEPLFLKFFFSLPHHERRGKRYFNETFSKMFPDFFDFPTKDYGYKYSRSRWRDPLHRSKFFVQAMAWRMLPGFVSHPKAAYVDMRRALNHRRDVSATVDHLLDALATRDVVPHADIRRAIRLHRRGIDFTRDIITLASLEAILRAARL